MVRYGKSVRNGWSTSLFSFSIIILFVSFQLTGWIFNTGNANAAHELADNECYDCHAVGGAKGQVVTGTRLIKKDTRMVEIQTQGSWTSGPLPCIYCHQDSTSIRTNMAGVKTDFSSLSISKHPVDYFSSNTASQVGGTLIGGNMNINCVDCHENVEYVGQGTSPGATINPNIHGKDTTAVAWTDSTGGQLDVAATFYGTLSPYNADNNEGCTLRCHDAGYTDVNTRKQFHAYGATLVSLEGESAGAPYTTVPQGCLSANGSTTGCHGIHNSSGNTDIIELKKPDGTYVSRTDCGICHTFDDPPDNRAISEYNNHGHGYTNIQCTQCHDSTVDHFDTVADPTGNRLISENTQVSTFSSTKTLLSNCNTCHNYQAHSTLTTSVGCLDCHDPHGRGIEDGTGANIRMVRRQVPVKSGPTTTMIFTTSAVYWDSTTPTGTYSNLACDNADCHNPAIGGPGPISSIMETNGTHTGGTGPAVYDCATCHKHDDTAGSMRAVASCSDCHGDSVAGNNWPQTVATAASIHPDRAGAHNKHVTAMGTSNSSCSTCHPGNPPVGHPDLTATGTSLAELSQMDTNGDSVADTWLSTNILNSVGTTDVDAYYNVVAQTCGSVDCHSGSTTPDWYGGGTLDCNSCHLSHPGTGKHKKHANTNSNYTECDNCHGDATWSPSGNATGGSAYTTGGPAGSPHNDGVKTLYFPNNNAIWNSPNCTNVDCHDNNGPFNWWN